MRLHHLEITGFGPFPETVRIDFDALSEAGLFLLSGPTGAGKSSILDAVTFALYGDVPGDRSTAKRLRSDHADVDVVPRVVLEATLSGRRFRLDRSPSWQRPKKRGTGLTTEQARVVISERLTSSDSVTQWHPLSTRLDETGHLVTRLLGMNLSQFCQVAMLPQGRFQDFLRSTSQERHALLQQVFQTGRFDQMERWLRDHRISLRRTSESHHSSVADLVSRISEVSTIAAPHEWDSAPAELVPWVVGLADVTERQCAEATLSTQQAQTRERDAGDAAAAGIALARLQQTHDEAERSLRDLEGAGAAHSAAVDRLRAARRAEGIRPLHEVSMGAAHTVEVAQEVFAVRREALADLLGAALSSAQTLDDEGWVEDQRREAAHLLSEITRVRPLQTQVESLESEQAAELIRREECRTEAAGVTTRVAQVLDELSVVQTRRKDVHTARNTVDALQGAVAGWAARLEAAQVAETLEGSVERAHDALRESSARRLVAREDLVEIREQRLDGMAAEIARQLAVGASCPVCGSHEHPSPASVSVGAADDTSERAARTRVDDLEVTVEAHAQQVRGLEAQFAAATATAGDSSSHLALEFELATTELSSARHDALVAEEDAHQVTRLEAEHTQLVSHRDTLATTVAHCETSLAVLATRIESLGKDLHAVLADRGHESLDALASHTQSVESTATHYLEAAADVRRSRATAQQAWEHADRAAREAGFDSVSDATVAWLAPEDVRALEHEVQRHERELVTVRHTLADPRVSQAATTPVPDLERLAAAHVGAQEESATAGRTQGLLVGRRDRLAGLGTQLQEALDTWAPVRHDLDGVTDLAAFVEGKHPDNRLQMRLSAYVLAHRLSQVVQAANLRLCAMSDQRYSLVHTGQRGAGETRGGLSLLVRDEWSGESRDPATLSGGETFVVSLALALGLADVITEEAGGADLGTLFVDEGFGSLDADTLEDVMDTLDTLRDGGRVVGVVSHVPELQTRIPTQLHVHKARHGSRTSVRLG